MASALLWSILIEGFDAVTKNDLQAIKNALVGAGVEIYRTRPAEIQLAERVRLHIMDSGVRVLVDEELTVAFTARAQRNDFPHESADALFARVRSAIDASAAAHGFAEFETRSVDVMSPSSDSNVLDVWHEISYVKKVSDVQNLIEEAQWALSLEKYVQS